MGCVSGNSPGQPAKQRKTAWYRAMCGHSSAALELAELAAAAEDRVATAPRDRDRLGTAGPARLGAIGVGEAHVGAEQRGRVAEPYAVVHRRVARRPLGEAARAGDARGDDGHGVRRLVGGKHVAAALAGAAVDPAAASADAGLERTAADVRAEVALAGGVAVAVVPRDVGA